MRLGGFGCLFGRLRALGEIVVIIDRMLEKICLNN